MENRKKIFCDHDIIRFITEEKLVEAVGEQGILSVSQGNKLELMIFFGKDENQEFYEVRVYKAKLENKYVPHPSDKVVKYEENDEYASFFFDSFKDGINFVYFLPYLHEEYRTRPSRKIGE